jgi:hypothetical protein
LTVLHGFCIIKQNLFLSHIKTLKRTKLIRALLTDSASNAPSNERVLQPGVDMTFIPDPQYYKNKTVRDVMILSRLIGSLQQNVP